MKINETIRKYRKELNLTQEQVANYLGVTAPAVNKWENGISYPDITLLAPLARILHIDVDTLLSFQEQLTEQEINQHLNDVIREVNTKGFQEAFQQASDKVKQYPTCSQLILNTAQVLQAYYVMKKEEIAEGTKYEKQMKAWYESVAFGEDKELANQAILSLSHDYMMHENYEEAQKLLDQIPPMGFDKRNMQAVLFHKQGQTEKAFELHENMIYQYANSAINNFMQMTEIFCDQKQYEKALEYAELISKVSSLFGFGQYMGIAARMEIYVKMQKEAESLQAIKELFSVGIDMAQTAKESGLYKHMALKQDSGTEELENIMKKGLKEDKEFDFLRQNEEFKALIETL